MAGSLAVGIFGIVASSLVSYGLGPELRGSIGLLLLLTSFAVTIGTLGLGDALVVSHSRIGLLSRQTLVGLSALVSLLAAAAGLLLGALYGRDTDLLIQYSLFGALVSGSVAMWRLPSQYLLAQRRTQAWNLSRIAASLNWVVSVTLVVLQSDRLDSGQTLMLMGAAFALSNVALAAVLLILSTKRLSPPHQSALAERFDLKSQLGIALPSGASSLLALLSLGWDRLYAGWTMSALALGLYVAAFAYGSIFTVMLQAVGNYAFPRLAKLRDQRQEQALAVLYRNSGSLALALGLLGMLAAYPAILVLNGSDFRAAQPTAVIWAATGALSGALYSVYQGMKAAHMQRTVLRLEASRAILLIVLTLAIAPRSPASLAILSLLATLLTWIVAGVAVGRATRTRLPLLLQPVSPRQIRRSLEDHQRHN